MLGTFFHSWSFSYTWTYSVPPFFFSLSFCFSLFLSLVVGVWSGGFSEPLCSVSCSEPESLDQQGTSQLYLVFASLLLGHHIKPFFLQCFCFFFVFIPVFTEGMFHYVSLPHQTQWTLTPTFSAAYHYLAHTAKHPRTKIVFPFPWPSAEWCYSISHTDWQKQRGIEGNISCQGGRQLHGKHW